MNPTLIIWLELALCTGLIGVAGVRLSLYGDVIATHTGLSRNWVGLIFLATVTSLPELITGLSAVTVAAAPDIAMGDVLGSCVFNLAIFAFIDLLYRGGSLYAVVGRGHLVSAAFGVILLAGVALAMLLSAQGLVLAFGHISAASLLLMGGYLMAMRTLYLVEQQTLAPPVTTKTARATQAMTLKSALMGYALASAVIIGAGIWLPMVGVRLATLMGWSNSFVGTLFIALATSVPELATTWGALRIGALDMAVGNLLGSNLFDVLILAIDDMAYLPGPIFSGVSPAHAVSAIIACLMGGTVILALAYRPGARVAQTARWVSGLLLTFYLLNAFLQFKLGQPA
ncbi:MAG: sodium:calcium antiporter [Rhodoferax sp.]|jgi:cation:H+ antiporter|uniref:sodium:calcium antiporter n=1 Tax=Rhodoferax sp. TaxID=50421 RepID=UPI001B5F206C|nr:sodium:calcium antiporter [Rhodoferax sp.]MBP9737127.1 sodium:calcium antiporter [Rhodoferax sp.]